MKPHIDIVEICLVSNGRGLSRRYFSVYFITQNVLGVNMLKVGRTIRFCYNNRTRVVRLEKVANDYITGYVINENNKPKSFSRYKMSHLQPA